MKSVITNDTIKEIIRLYKSGFSQQNVAIELNLSEGVVRNIIKTKCPELIHKNNRGYYDLREGSVRMPKKKASDWYEDMKSRYERNGMTCPTMSQLMAGK